MTAKTVEPFVITLADAQLRYGRGKNRMREEAEDAHAIVRIGSKIRIHVPTMDKYYTDHVG